MKSIGDACLVTLLVLAECFRRHEEAPERVVAGALVGAGWSSDDWKEVCRTLVDGGYVFPLLPEAQGSVLRLTPKGYDLALRIERKAGMYVAG